MCSRKPWHNGDNIRLYVCKENSLMAKLAEASAGKYAGRSILQGHRLWLR